MCFCRPHLTCLVCEQCKNWVVEEKDLKIKSVKLKDMSDNFKFSIYFIGKVIETYLQHYKLEGAPVNFYGVKNNNNFLCSSSDNYIEDFINFDLSTASRSLLSECVYELDSFEYADKIIKIYINFQWVRR